MRYVITHGHIFKNAGSTFDYALERAFGKDFCDHRDDKDMLRGGAEYLKKFILDNPKIKAISSHHMCNPLPVSDEFQCIPIYFVRNPIDRVLSVYNFERKQKKGTRGAEMASKLSLEEYVRWRMSPEAPKVIFDYQTAYIGRTKNLRPNDSVTTEMLQRALGVVIKQKALVGTVERFGESFDYITQHLSSYFPGVNFKYEKKNVANNASSKEKFQQAVIQLGQVLGDVISRNAFDMALYKAADSKLNQLVKNDS